MSSADSLDFGVLLNIAFATFRDALDADLAAPGFDAIGSSSGYVFRRLAEAPSSLSELAALLGMSPPGALKVVDDMVAKGYVSRSADGTDRRVKQLALTDRGQAALARAREFHKRYEQNLAEIVGQRQVAATRTVLELMAASAAPSGRKGPRPS